MKKSELKTQIEEIITELLSEITTITKQTKTSEIPTISRSEEVPPQTVSKAIAKAKSSGQDVDIAESEEDDDSPVDKEPTKSELRKNAGVAKVKDELAKVTKEMKDLAKEYTKAEGDKKDKIKTQLKDLTAKKKDLEKKLDKAL